jgi:hypothetical protein
VTERGAFWRARHACRSRTARPWTVIGDVRDHMQNPLFRNTFQVVDQTQASSVRPAGSLPRCRSCLRAGRADTGTQAGQDLLPCRRSRGVVHRDPCRCPSNHGALERIRASGRQPAARPVTVLPSSAGKRLETGVTDTSILAPSRPPDTGTPRRDPGRPPPEGLATSSVDPRTDPLT